MEYLDAHKGLEIYKESIVANDRLQQYYQQIEQIEELRRAIQFPKLESPPADFLTQMEAYAKEAPRPYDESSGAVSGSKKVTLCAVPYCHALPHPALPCPALPHLVHHRPALLHPAHLCPATLCPALPCPGALCCVMLQYAAVMSFQWPCSLTNNATVFSEEPSLEERHQVQGGWPGPPRRAHRDEG